MSGEEWSIKEFRALHATIAQRSITGAAAQLGLSQPAVSRAIANLENKVGTRLFERSGRSIIPTDEAVRINTELFKFFETMDDLRAKSSNWNGISYLRVAAPPTFTAGHLQRIIASFVANHPEISIELEVRSSSKIVGMVAQGDVDLGISDHVIDTHNIVRQPFCSSFLSCFVPAKHDLANRETISVEQLESEHIIGLSRRHYARVQLDRAFRSAGIEKTIKIETNTSVSALAFVEEGLGIALMNPFPLAHEISRKIKIVKFTPEIAYSSAFILPADGSLKRSTSRFMRHVKRSLREKPWATIL